jgi:hypothetical protein
MPGSDVKRLHRLPATKLALVRKYHAAKAVDPRLTQEAWCKRNNVAGLSFRKWLPAQAMKGLTQAAATWTGRRSRTTPYRLARYAVQEDGLFLAFSERHLGCQLCPRDWLKAKMWKLVYTAFPDLPKEGKGAFKASDRWLDGGQHAGFRQRFGISVTRPNKTKNKPRIL